VNQEKLRLLSSETVGPSWRRPWPMSGEQQAAYLIVLHRLLTLVPSARHFGSLRTRTRQSLGTWDSS